MSKYEDKMYELKDIPKGICFSTNSVLGAYYEDTEPGEKRSYHKYDTNGDLIISSAYPDRSVQYYLSDAKGNRLKSVAKYQYMCFDNNGNWKVTTNRYITKSEAMEARRSDRWHVMQRVEASMKAYVVIEEPAWQWFYSKSTNDTLGLTEHRYYTKEEAQRCSGYTCILKRCEESKKMIRV